MEATVKSELTALVEVINKLRKIHWFLVKHKNTRSIVKAKLEREGKVNIGDDDILGRFNPAEAKQFFEMYVIAYGGSFDGELLMSVKREPEPPDKHKKDPDIPEKDIECVKRVARSKAITQIADLIAWFPDDQSDRIKSIFEEIGKMENDFLAADKGSILIYVPEVDKTGLKAGILEHIGKIKSGVERGERVLLNPADQEQIVHASLGMNLSTNEATKLLKRVFRNNREISWDGSEMKYEVGSESYPVITTDKQE